MSPVPSNNLSRLLCWLSPALLLLSCCGVEGSETAALATGPSDRFLVDLRAPEDFARGHEPAAINLQWGFGQFELRARRLFPEGSSLVLIAADEAQGQAAAEFAREAGYPSVEARVFSAGESMQRQEIIDAKTLQAELAADRITVLDARTAEEYAAGHIRSALFVYPDDIGRASKALRKDRSLAVICTAGWRSSLVTSWLEREGFERVVNVIGGMREWQELGLPVETGRQQESFR
ncbi:MAG: rhodanese-like domain-containing protein [Planctomycetota bacterium]